MFIRQVGHRIHHDLTVYEIASLTDGYREFSAAVCRILARSEEEVVDSGVSESQLNFICKLMFVEWDESTTSTIFDLFDMDSKYKLDISQIYVLFVLACSTESKQMMHFIHKFGKVTYDMMVSRGQGMLYDKLLCLTGLIYDKSSVEIRRMLQRVGIDKECSISFSDFEVFMFDSIKSTNADTGDSRSYLYDLDMQTHKAKCFEQKKSKSPGSLATGHIPAMNSLTNQCCLI